ncbi:hypothetical protein G7Y89_g14098 [Cudoniella acicularis]|uniref:WSC domain-containing protein n=1 Tax=Cudoniella acicularis TaxID=354080 RepID=A0A8H4R692_9HELO|nr:hypothetical protein G7Y89_g14098 [Cudoniella acicularis]
MSVEVCAIDCAGYTYFGLEEGVTCYCGNVIEASGVLTSPSDCSFACTGNAEETCGGELSLEIYRYGFQPSSSSRASTSSSSTSTGTICSSFTTSTGHSSSTSTVSTTTALPSLTIVPIVGAYTYIGCYTDAANRALTAATIVDYPNMSLEDCSADCTGYTYFGVENSGEYNILYYNIGVHAEFRHIDKFFYIHKCTEWPKLNSEYKLLHNGTHWPSKFHFYDYLVTYYKFYVCPPSSLPSTPTQLYAQIKISSPTKLKNKRTTTFMQLVDGFVSTIPSYNAATLFTVTPDGRLSARASLYAYATTAGVNSLASQLQFGPDDPTQIDTKFGSSGSLLMWTNASFPAGSAIFTLPNVVGANLWTAYNGEVPEGQSQVFIQVLPLGSDAASGGSSGGSPSGQSVGGEGGGGGANGPVDRPGSSSSSLQSSTTTAPNSVSSDPAPGNSVSNSQPTQTSSPSSSAAIRPQSSTSDNAQSTSAPNPKSLDSPITSSSVSVTVNSLAVPVPQGPVSQSQS